MVVVAGPGAQKPHKYFACKVLTCDNPPLWNRVRPSTLKTSSSPPSVV